MVDVGTDIAIAIRRRIVHIKIRSGFRPVIPVTAELSHAKQTPRTNTETKCLLKMFVSLLDHASFKLLVCALRFQQAHRGRGHRERDSE